MLHVRQESPESGPDAILTEPKHCGATGTINDMEGADATEQEGLLLYTCREQAKCTCYVYCCVTNCPET